MLIRGSIASHFEIPSFDLSKAAISPLPVPPAPDPYVLSRRERLVDTVLLNPQPLPPGPDPELLLFGAEVSLNPQPLPPAPDPYSQFFNSLFGDEVAINPQPLPPGPEAMFSGSDIKDWVTLNPQPLPPGPDPEARLQEVRFNAGSEVSLNPQPLPPEPDGSRSLVQTINVALRNIASGLFRF